MVRVLRPAYPIVTPRLLLRPFTVGDVPGLHHYQSLPDVCRYLPYEPRTLERVQQVVADARSTLDEPGNIQLAVERRSDGALVGDVILMWHSRELRSGEIGYVFDPRFAGNGYATEAARALLALAFGHFALRRVVARIDARNEASAAVLRRIGMRQEAHFVQAQWLKGQWADEVNFALLAAEWRVAQAGAPSEDAP
jgi:RimJ/RimL family protein N-acetyltransferase